MPIVAMDKLQILKRDKKQFQILLLPKDLKILTKERKEEIVNGKVFLDLTQEEAKSEPMVLIIDRSISEKYESPSTLCEGRDLLSNCESGLSGFPERVSSNGCAEGESESDDDGSDNNEGEVQQKRKKKRRGPSFNSGQRKTASSKNLQNLPAYLSDFSWIENT